MTMTAMTAQRPIAGEPEFVERRRYPRPNGTFGTKPVDRTYLRRFTLGNLGLEREVLYLFANEVPSYLSALKQAATAKQWHDAAHTVKGAARAIGAWRLARVAEQAEKLRFDTDLDKRQFCLDTAREAADEAVRYINEIFPET